MNYAVALSWRRIRLGVWLALALLILGGAYVTPWPVLLLDSGVAVPNSLFVLWLAGKLFSGDDTSPEEAHLRSLPLDPGRLLLARALLGLAVLAGVLLIQLPFWYLGASGWLRATLFDERALFQPPAELSLLCAYLFAVFGGTAWFAKSLGHVAASKAGHWTAWSITPLLVLHPALFGGPFHAWLTPLLFAAGAFGLAGAARCAARREVWAASGHQWVLGSPRRGDAGAAVPAQLTFVAIPLILLAMWATRALEGRPGAPGLVPTLALITGCGACTLPLAHARARRRNLGPAARIGLYALALSGIGWAFWHTLRRPHPEDEFVGRFRLPYRYEAGLTLLIAPIVALFLLGHCIRPVQAWRLVVRAEGFGSEHAPYVEDAEILLDGNAVGLGYAEGTRIAPVFGDVFLGKLSGTPAFADLHGARTMDTRALIEALGRARGTSLPPDRELERSLPRAQLEVRLGGATVPLTSVVAQSFLELGRRSTVVTLHVDAAELIEEIDEWNRWSLVAEEAQLERWTAGGDALWREVRRYMPAGLLPRRGAAGEWSEVEPLGADQRARREHRLALLEDLLRRRYAGAPATAFERIWSDLEFRRAQLEPLGHSHFCGGPRTHFLYLEPQLRALALLDGEGRARLDARLRAGDAHAALAAGLRGDASDAPLLERMLAERRGIRSRVDGGVMHLQIDDRALIYAWALLAVDRERGTAVLRDALGEPDPLPVELLVINTGGAELATELERWIDTDDETLGRLWRLGDRHQVRDLRKRFERALYATSCPVSPIDYFEQAPGFLALVARDRGEGGQHPLPRLDH